MVCQIDIVDFLWCICDGTNTTVQRHIVNINDFICKLYWGKSSIRAVSYTHLDVYKRQVRTCQAVFSTVKHPYAVKNTKQSR